MDKIVVDNSYINNKIDINKDSYVLINGDVQANNPNLKW